MIDISGIRFQFTSSTGLYLSLLFPYEVFCSIYISFFLCMWLNFLFSFLFYIFLLSDSEIYRPSYTFSSYKKTDSFLSVCNNVWIWKMIVLVPLTDSSPCFLAYLFSQSFRIFDFDKGNSFNCSVDCTSFFLDFFEIPFR